MVAVRSLIPVMAQYAGLVVVVVMVMVESHNRWVAEESPDAMAHLVEEEEMDDLGVDYLYLCLCVVVGFLMNNARVWVKEVVL
ncbi:hypothetical protein EV2_032385 [Malus domestica]